MKRSGVADLPLHGGRVPNWLAQRMTVLGTGITEAIIHGYGPSGFLSTARNTFQDVAQAPNAFEAVTGDAGFVHVGVVS